MIQESKWSRNQGPRRKSGREPSIITHGQKQPAPSFARGKSRENGRQTEGRGGSAGVMSSVLSACHEDC